MFDFIDRIADHIIDNYRDDLKDLKVLFPNQRAAFFLGKRLSHKLDEAYINPKMMSVDRLVDSHCEMVVPERISLVHKLYKCSQAISEREESFAHFYNWGDKVLNDFDLLDKHLVVASDLFETIDDINQIEERFSYLSEESLELLKNFWRTVGKSNQVNSWENGWEESGLLYQRFTHELKKNEEAYPGMKYRYVAENLDLLSKWKESPVIIAGFNRISTSEMKIIQHLDHADFFWDVDDYYMDNDHLAGRFMRQNVQRFSNSAERSNLLSEGEKNVTVYNLSKSNTQSRIAMQHMKDCNWKADRTMILLPDESQLLPLLTQIPESIKDLNVSMGWPVSESPVATLLNHIVELHLDYEEDLEAFPTLHIYNLMRHAYITRLLDKEYKFTNVSEWTELNELEKYQKIYPVVFKPLGSKLEIFDRLIKFVEILFHSERNIEIDEDDNSVVGSGVFLIEILRYIHKKLIRLRDIFRPLADSVNLKELIYLFNQIFRSTRIPFSGQPLSGLQILGPLEARSLDYDHVIVFNMKEGSWPPGFSESTIPHNLKKAYGMPVTEDEISEFSYYFWSLFSGTKDVVLLNPEDTAAYNPQGVSRFVHELRLIKDNFNYSEESISRELNVSDAVEHEIKKDESIIGRIKSKPHLSASSILTYGKCPLRYYFSYVEGLREVEKYTPDLDVTKFGEVFHNVMEDLYGNYSEHKKLITKETLESFKEDKKTLIHRHYREIMNVEEFQFKRGSHLFNIKTLEQYCDNVIEFDKIKAPFMVLEVEKEFSKDFIYNTETGESVIIKGFVDRIDEKDGKISIIDYKTGKVKYSVAEEDLFEEKQIQKYSNNLQVLFYRYLLKEEYPDSEAQLYGVKEIANVNAVEDLNIKLKRNRGRTLIERDETDEIIRNGFGRLIQEMYDPEKNFPMTSELNNCRYCDHQFTCNRNPGGYS